MRMFDKSSVMKLVSIISFIFLCVELLKHKNIHMEYLIEESDICPKLKSAHAEALGNAELVGTSQVR